MGVNYNNKGSREIIAEMRRNALEIEINGQKYDLQTIYESKKLKEQLVEENPKLAEQLYYRWRDTGEQEIGWFFAVRYNGHEEYGQSAYHIGSELGVPGIKRQDNPSSEHIKRLEEGFFM